MESKRVPEDEPPNIAPVWLLHHPVVACPICRTAPQNAAEAPDQRVISGQQGAFSVKVSHVQA